jgi:hypothetical protein
MTTPLVAMTVRLDTLDIYREMLRQVIRPVKARARIRVRSVRRVSRTLTRRVGWLGLIVLAGLFLVAAACLEGTAQVGTWTRRLTHDLTHRSQSRHARRRNTPRLHEWEGIRLRVGAELAGLD